jgi:hypothetical protein
MKEAQVGGMRQEGGSGREVSGRKAAPDVRSPAGWRLRT